MNYLNEQKKTGVLANDWAQVDELYNKKLWHQLTLKMQEMVLKPEMLTGSALINLYQNFISDFEHRINPLSLVEICLPIVKQVREQKGDASAVEFLEKLKEKVQYDAQSKILCSTSIGTIHLEDKRFDLTKKIVEETEQELNDLDGVTTVHARFYELSSNYYRIIGNHTEYYRNSLRNLGCRNFETIPVPERQQRAFYLGLAAIMGDDIYNFGELLMHPILDSLKTTADSWLVELLFAFNRGDLDKFEQLRGKWSQQPDLNAAETRMRQKICLLCLMEIAFGRTSASRQISFEEVAVKTKLSVDQVELLVMKALSLNLVKGFIDEVEHKIYINWVQPRVLDLTQIRTMRARLDNWSSEVYKTIGLVNDTAHEILT